MKARDLFLAPELQPQEISDFLAAHGFANPARADEHLQQIVRLIEDPERLARMADNLLGELSSSVDPDAGVRHLEAFLESVPSPVNLLALLEDSPRALEILAGILGASPYLTQSLIRNPEYFYWLIERSRLQQIVDFDYFRSEAEAATRPFPTDSSAALEALRRLRRRESLRIGAQDMLGLATMQDTVAQISDLAGALLDETLRVVAGNRSEPVKGFTVIGLGKLGGRELNFSSDVDLIFVFEDSSERDRMTRLAKDYTRTLGEFTGEGHLFRVDLRLRPMGKAGEIAYSLDACTQYYQTWADTTDRLALLKSRPVAGDIDLGERFQAMAQEVVYKKYLDHAAVEEIRWIKKRTDDALRKKRQSRTHVKLGLGGIREIEFFAQSFQLLYGGVQEELRTPSTLPALNRLLDLGFIGQGEFQALRSAYLFLRDLEHKLQLVNDLQTHSLPEEESELVRCARRMGYRPRPGEPWNSVVEDFKNDLNSFNLKVRQIFDSLFEDSHEERDLGEVVLNSSLDPQVALERLRQRGVDDPEPVLEGIQLLSQAPSFPYSPTRVRNLLANLVPVLVEEVRFAPHPREIFSRLDRFCESLNARVPLYTELIENPAFATRFVTLLSLGEDLAETLIRFPELLDSVVRPADPADPATVIEAFLSDQAKAGTPRREALRIFKQRKEVKVAIGELDRPGGTQGRLTLSRLAEACLGVAWNEAMDRFPALLDAPCALIALGKLGGRELAFHSDLDLVFLLDDSRWDRSLDPLFEALKFLRDDLHEYTPAGRAYEIDFRLRPEGRHAGEVVPLSRFLEYFTDRLEPWERLAWVKARQVLGNAFELDLETLVFRSVPFTEEETASLRHVRKRKELEIGKEGGQDWYDFKVGRGALLDLQFLVQYLQVQSNIPSTNLLSAIDKLNTSVILSDSHCSRIREAVHFYYSLEMLKDLEGERFPGRLRRSPDENRMTAHLLGYEQPAQLVSRYEEISQSVRALYHEVLGAEKS